MSAAILVQAIVNGVLIGGIYGLVSIGVSLIFGVLKIVNFAHGEFLMVAMFATYWLWALLGLDPLLSLGITMPLLFVLGLVVQEALFRRVIGASDLPQIFLTFGLSLLLQNLALLAFSANVRSVITPYTDTTISVAGQVFVGVPRLIAFLVAVALSAALALFLARTDLGQAMRAAAQNRDVAMLMGINPNHVFRVAVGLAAALAGAAGTLITPFFPVYPHVGTQFVLLAFAVVILGTLGDLRGAFLAGLLIGVAESLGIQFIGADSGRILVFFILLLTLILRPGGLLGGRWV
jgi:branched-chain amino acid transport system permease protein